MFSLRLACSRDDLDRLSADLWEAGTTGIQELDSNQGILLIAGFDTDTRQAHLLQQFSTWSPDWQPAPTTDWVEQTRKAWPGRPIGDRIFLAPPWCVDPAPPARVRIVHNPGLACGTGEHPCSQLALVALEKSVRRDTRVIDIGAGSGILALAALRLGASGAIGIDIDEAALAVARDNFRLNGIEPALIAGSAECLAAEIADITVANINATVLLSIFDDLLRITRHNGRLILTGFTEPEARPLLQLLPDAEASSLGEWRCLTARLS